MLKSNYVRLGEGNLLKKVDILVPTSVEISSGKDYIRTLIRIFCST